MGQYDQSITPLDHQVFYLFSLLNGGVSSYQEERHIRIL